MSETPTVAENATLTALIFHYSQDHNIEFTGESRTLEDLIELHKVLPHNKMCGQWGPWTDSRMENS